MRSHLRVYFIFHEDEVYEEFIMRCATALSECCVGNIKEISLHHVQYSTVLSRHCSA